MSTATQSGMLGAGALGLTALKLRTGRRFVLPYAYSTRATTEVRVFR